jgi:hypothetical protein
MDVAALALAGTALFLAGLLLGLGLRVRSGRPQPEPLLLELRGWLQCERALYAECSDATLLARLRTRVPCRLRLLHEHLHADATRNGQASVAEELSARP